jgi:tight adherence protein B
VKNLEKREWFCKAGKLLRWMLKGMLVCTVLTYFFYRSLWALFPMMLPSAIYVWWENKKEKRKQKKQLIRQFGECILSVGNSVKAGYAVEKAFVESMNDMRMMYGSDAEILEELTYIKGGLLNHMSLEILLQEVGIRTGVKEIQEFADVYEITRKSGGSLPGVASMTAQTISNKTALEEEIYSIQASKRLEQKIMNLVPFFMMSYMELTTEGYFDMYYKDFGGRVIMTIFLVWYISAYAVSEYVLYDVGI